MPIAEVSSWLSALTWGPESRQLTSGQWTRGVTSSLSTVHEGVGNERKTVETKDLFRKVTSQGRAGMPVTPDSSSVSSVSRSKADWSAKFLDLESPKRHSDT